MRRLSILAVAVGLVAGSALAEKHEGTSGGFGCFGPTLALVDFSKLNSSLSAYGSQKLSSMHWTFGGAGYAFVNRIVLGGSGWGGSQSVSLRHDSLLCRVSYSGGQFEAGYMVIDLKHLLVAPLLGVGGAGYEIELEPISSNAPSFDSLLASPGRTSSVSTTSFSLVPQLMVTVPVSFIGLQFKAGYCFAPGAPEWKFADGARLFRGPELPRATPFIALNVVFGGLGRDTKRRIKPPSGIEPRLEQDSDREDED
ncbi:MAG: hypothetical protein ABIK86_03555 [candidate division WOR-3 bacterium]